MVTDLTNPALIDALAEVALEAGARIAALAGCRVAAKLDGSPVTIADQEAEEIILKGLTRLVPGLPVLAEEQAASGVFPRTTDQFVAVDPLDGTREFVAGRDEYTVNIALVDHGHPVAGVVYAPALGQLWWGAKQAETCTIEACGLRLSDARERRFIKVRPRPSEGPTALVSRSHGEAAVDRWLDDHHVMRRVPLGSSLKFCRIAEGAADLTVRFTPINEWDVAAGHAVLAAAGGAVTRLDGSALVYGQAGHDFRIGPYLARGAAI